MKMGEDPCKKSSGQSPKPDPKSILKSAASLKEKIAKLNSFPKYILKSLPDWKTFYRKQIGASSNIVKMWMYRNCDPTKMADKPTGPPSRPMKYPYTFSAKFAQFPLSYYFKNQWIWKYYFLSVAACVPVFYSIQKLANSPGNVAKWAEIRRKEAAEHH